MSVAAPVRSPVSRASSTAGSSSRARSSRSCSASETRSAASGVGGAPFGAQQQRRSGLGVDAEAPGAFVRRARARRVAAQTTDLSELVEAGAREPAVCADERLALPAELLLDDVPAALGADHLELVDAGDAGVHEGLRQRRRPAGQGLGPVAHPGQVGQPVAEVDRRAVDVACPECVDPSGEHGQHRLVEEREARGGLAPPDGRHPVEDQGEAGEGLVLVLLGEGADPGGRPLGRRGIALHVHGEGALDVERGAVHGSGREVAEQSFGPVHPGQRDLHVTARGPGQAEPERTVGGPLGRALGAQPLVDVLGHRHRRGRVTQPPGGLAERGQVVGAEAVAHRLEPVVDRAPVPPRVSLARLGHQRHDHGSG